ncbi:MAG TPA: SCO family protein [Sphingomicrobium sp.]
MRIILWALVAVALVAFAFLSLQPARTPAPQPQPMVMTSIGGPFTLIGSDGKPFSSAKLNGNPYVIFFGFTHCPDVCPTTLARLVKLRKELSDEPFEIVFVTVDPERDGPTEVGSYAKAFNSPIIGLTGSPAQIEQVKKQFGIFSQKVPDESGGYSVDHTATVFLFGRDGKFVGTVAPEEGDEVALEKLKRISA